MTCTLQYIIWNETEKKNENPYIPNLTSFILYSLIVNVFFSFTVDLENPDIEEYKYK